MKHHLDSYELVIENIVGLLRDNLLLMRNSDESLLPIKEYVRNYAMDVIPYDELVYLTDLAVAEFINLPFWYDFRDIE